MVRRRAADLEWLRGRRNFGRSRADSWGSFLQITERKKKIDSLYEGEKEEHQSRTDSVPTRSSFTSHISVLENKGRAKGRLK